MYFLPSSVRSLAKKTGLSVGIILLVNALLVAQTNCTKIDFQKIISAAGDDQAYDVAYTPDNGFLLCGRTTSSGAGGYDALAIKMDFNGNIIWSKTYGSAGDDAFHHIISTKDGNYIAVGWSQFNLTHVNDVFIVKFDPNGNLIWAKSYGAGTPNGEVGYGIVETDDGGFVIAGDYNTNPTVVQPLYLKLDQNGNLLWVDVMNVNTAGEAFDVVADGNYITGAGVSAVGGITTFNDGYLVKLQSTDGSLLWLKNIESENRSNRLNDITLKNGEYVLDMYNADSWVGTNEKPLIFTTDTSGNLLYSESYEVTGINTDMIYESIYPTADNGYIASLSEAINNTTPRLVKISQTGSIDWVSNYSSYYFQHLTKVIQDPSGEYVATGIVNNNTGSNGDIIFLKTDAHGNIKDTTGNPVCPVTHSPAQNNNISIQVSNADYFTVTTGGVQSVSANVVVAAFSPQIQNPCISSNTCDTLKIKGNDSVCNFSQTGIFQAFKDSNCYSPVQWNIDPSFAAIVSSSDSTVQLQFKKNGQGFLYAKMTSCNILQDSLQITAMQSPDSVNLGPDITQCENNISPITLHAGGGFKTYLWQDGSTDSTFQTNQAGKYFVVAQNYCGINFRDTLLVTLGPPVSFNLGPDLKKCSNDTLTIVAPPGFNGYSWSPDYAISNINSQTIDIFTATDTAYICHAKAGIGCTVADTIRVNVFQSAIINLGNDTSFCHGDSLVLNAGSGFTSYQWSNGATSQQITVGQTGNYWVKATDLNDCLTKDTLMLQVFTLPVVNIGPDTFVCKNSSYTFNAGSHFINYLWQDGSVNPTFSATQPGTYWVKVTDANDCSNADTAKILAVIDLPQNFLADTASICAGYLLQLQAIGHWTSYKWFDSTTTTSTTITSPGIYWLQVTDSMGCSAADSIIVSGKNNCILGVYFPNAFTPN
ncbi:MAG TPA: hypothetical protein VKR53_21820, partial [Puia sp.]|nr:hypothetical protein [Puia sp.]